MLSVPFTLYFPGCVSSSCPVTLVLFLSLITQLLSSQALSVSPLASSTSVLPFHSFLFHSLLVVTLSPPEHFFVGSSLTCVFELPLFFLSVDVCCCLSVLKYSFGLSFLKLFFKFFFLSWGGRYYTEWICCQYLHRVQIFAVYFLGSQGNESNMINFSWNFKLPAFSASKN